MTDDTGLSRRRFLQATGGAAAAATLAGCSSSPGGSGGNGGGGTETTGGGGGSDADITKGVKNPDPSKKLKRILSGTITTFDPIAATDSASGTVIRQMFEGLTVYPNGKTNAKSLLAKEYERSKDFTTYTFTLKDAEFHNGKKVTAQDFVYSFERLAASKNSRRARFILDSLNVKHETVTTTKDGETVEAYKSDTLAVKAVDDKTLEITLESPFHATLEMLAYTSFAAIPKNIVGDLEGVNGKMPYKKFASKNPIGSGPFEFKEWQPGTAAEVTRFDGYHGGKASISGVHLQIIEKDNPRFTYAMEKNADLFEIPTSKYKPDKVSVNKETDFGGNLGTYGQVRNGETLNYYHITPIVTRYIGFNMDKVPKPVRQAFAYAANNKLIVNELFKGKGQPATHFTPPSIFPNGPDGYEKHGKKYPYNATKTRIDKAKKVMEDAGYGKNNEFTIQLTRYQDKAWAATAKLLRDQLASAHINVNIQPTDFSTLTKEGRQGKLEAYTLGWISDWPAPDNFLNLLYPPATRTTNQAPISYINWSSKNGSAAKQATKAYNKVRENQAPTEKAQKTRNKQYFKIEEANWEDVGFLNLYHSWSQRFWYDWVEIEPYGGMDKSRQMLNNVKIGERK